MNTMQAGFGGRNVIGFDLGHAHTTLATMSVAGRELKILEISKRKVQTTALKRRYAKPEHQRNGYTVLFGDRVFNHTPPEDELHIGFKRRPSHDPVYQKNMAEFFAAVLNDIDNSGQLQGWSQTTIIVGCPSAWSKQERERYQQLLTVTGYPEPLVISESRAALLHTIVSEEAKVKLQDFDNTILVVDVGSSTVDFTLIHGMRSEEPLADFGDDIGGAFFDQAIYDYAVAHHPQPEQLRSLLALNRNLEPKFLYLCRKAKEKYFAERDDFEHDNVPGFTEDLETIKFGPIVNGAVMAEILAKPTKSGKPWIPTFAGHLQRAKQIADAKGKPVRVIILTGGAARMHFVKETIDAIFPDSKLFVDSEPENSVAKGLAVWGRGDI
ncbi:MAG TPA: Hsp70 family protein, partial [Chloroflexi bacterium]|nr:Hsp70 family protein [Chloroflexota bacterium]